MVDKESNNKQTNKKNVSNETLGQRIQSLAEAYVTKTGQVISITVLYFMAQAQAGVTSADTLCSNIG